MAFDAHKDTSLRMLDASHLFESSITTIGIHRNTYIEGYLYDFIEMFLPGMGRAEVDAVIANQYARLRAQR